MVKPSLPPLASSAKPLVLLTGFLGAGKTSLLREILDASAARSLSVDVILNDYENAELDAETLYERAATVAPIAASCACCSGLQPLVELTLAAASSRHDLVVVEVNGTADPTPLLETFTLLESRIPLQPRWQVGVIDARHFGHRGPFDSLEIAQLETASHVVIRHAETLSSPERQQLINALRRSNPQASLTSAFPLVEQLVDIQTHRRKLLLPSPQPAQRMAPLPSLGHPLAHAFTGCQILLPREVDPDPLRAFLRHLPLGVLRAKALVTLRSEPDRRKLFERVAADITPEPLDVPFSDRVPSSAICIGPDLDPLELLSLARPILGPDCQLPCSLVA
ncbi:G3E family GTPase [Haloferula luteola]|uniref:G3E family GTPase n=1 Tax=Haloferula luteola TaxID=595692 RepID=A0A840UVV8_9BACT|nr:GTP-binding protein [Haloferula luteola]MBB5350317.1 G3E family GTPase [Haloferula luteola]